MKRKFWTQLEEWKKDNILTPLMVVGARQIGKTYIIHEFCSKNFNDYIYINLKDNQDLIKIFEEKINTIDKIKKMELLLNRNINEDTVIFIDEIQESEEIISALKFFCECDFPYKIVCAGSLLGVKLKRFNSSFPVGKVKIVKMFPMDFEEFLMALDRNDLVTEIKKHFENNTALSEPIHRKLLELYRLYICIGGMPDAIQNIISHDLNILNFDSQILSSIIDSYTADMKRYVNNLYESIKIEKIYNNIPSQLAKDNKKFQYGKLAKDARKRDYESSLEWLISSNLVLPNYYVKRFETPLKGFMDEDYFKLYISDVGILCKMLEMPYNKIMLDDNFMYKGIIAENYVAQELICHNYNLYFYQENQIAEIDFLIDTKDGIIPIEVKAGDNTESKSLNYYIKKNNPPYSIRISSKNFGFENNVKSVPLYAVFCIKK